MNNPDITFSIVSISYFVANSSSYSIHSSISGRTGIEIIPHDKPMRQRPRKIKTGYF